MPKLATGSIMGGDKFNKARGRNQKRDISHLPLEEQIEIKKCREGKKLVMRRLRERAAAPDGEVPTGAELQRESYRGLPKEEADRKRKNKRNERLKEKRRRLREAKEAAARETREAASALASIQNRGESTARGSNNAGRVTRDVWNPGDPAVAFEPDDTSREATVATANAATTGGQTQKSAVEVTRGDFHAYFDNSNVRSVLVDAYNTYMIDFDDGLQVKSLYSTRDLVTKPLSRIISYYFQHRDMLENTTGEGGVKMTLQHAIDWKIVENDKKKHFMTTPNHFVGREHSRDIDHDTHILVNCVKCLKAGLFGFECMDCGALIKICVNHHDRQMHPLWVSMVCGKHRGETVSTVGRLAHENTLREAGMLAGPNDTAGFYHVLPLPALDGDADNKNKLVSCLDSLVYSSEYDEIDGYLKALLYAIALHIATQAELLDVKDAHSLELSEWPDQIAVGSGRAILYIPDVTNVDDD